MKNFEVKYLLIVGLFAITAGCLVMASPYPSENKEDSRNDNYDTYDEDYADDQSASNQHSKTPAADSIAATARPFFTQNEIKVTGVVGNNITLECNANSLTESSVILWYKGEKLLTNNHQVLIPDYALDLDTNALNIKNATQNSQGEYFCEVLPQKVRLHTTLIVVDQPIETIIPESSTSSQDRCQFHLTLSFVFSSFLSISFYYLRT